MPGQEPIPSCRVKLFVMPTDKTQPIPLGLVEDFSATKAIRSENFVTVGDVTPPDNVSNFEDARVRWGKVFQPDPQVLEAITPRIERWTKWKPFNLLALDPDTNEPIAAAIGVRPESIDFTVRGGAAARQQYSGICKKVLLGDEVKQSS
jgi:hypothetical protein